MLSCLSEKLFFFIYFLSNEMINVEFCEKKLGIVHIAIDGNNYVRKVCASILLQNSSVIGRPNMTVEKDESLLI